MMLQLLACTALPWLGDEDTGSGDVALQGWVLAGPDAETSEDAMGGEGATLTLSSVQARFEDIEGTQPFESYSGYWRAEGVPEGEEYQLRLHGGEGWRDALWRGVAPPGDGLWAGLFGVNAEVADPILEDAGALSGLSPNLDGGVTVWGAVAEDQTLNLDSLRVEVAGAEARVDGFRLTEEGDLERATEDIDWFFAFNLPPGTIFLDVLGGEEPVSHAWVAEAGDVIIAWNLVPAQ